MAKLNLLYFQLCLVLLFCMNTSASNNCSAIYENQVFNGTLVIANKDIQTLILRNTVVYGNIVFYSKSGQVKCEENSKIYGQIIFNKIIHTFNDK